MREFETYTKGEQAMVVVPQEIFPSKGSARWAFLVALAEDGGWMQNTHDLDPTPLWRDRLVLRHQTDGKTYYRLDPRLRPVLLQLSSASG